eukprot:496326_1
MQVKLRQYYAKMQPHTKKSSYWFEYVHHITAEDKKGMIWEQKNLNYNSTYELTERLVPFIQNELHTNKILYIRHHVGGLSLAQLITRKGINLNYIKNIVINDMGCGFQLVTMIREPISKSLSDVAFSWQLWPKMQEKYDSVWKMLQLEGYRGTQLRFLYYGTTGCGLEYKDEEVKKCKIDVTQETLRETLKLMENIDII